MPQDMMIQIYIACTGALAVFLVGSTERKTRLVGCCLGMMSQPAWFYVTYAAEQWGIFALCFWYTLSWCRGIKNNWR